MASSIHRSTRRQFFSCSSAAAAVVAMHQTAATTAFSAFNAQPDTAPRIQSLELLSAASVAALKEFYHGLLGLRVLKESADRLTIAAGQTSLTFKDAAAIAGQPFYHFAFNIPENKIQAAWAWQRERTPLIPIPQRLQDPNFPAGVVNYAHWNAHSIFFFDPAGNVVEYIARHDLKNALDGDFCSDDVLYASEIAFVADDVPRLAGRLKEIAGIEQYRGGNEQFTALGDEHGLLLVMQRGRVISFDAPIKKSVDVFQTKAEVRRGVRGVYAVEGLPYEVRTF